MGRGRVQSLMRELLFREDHVMAIPIAAVIPNIIMLCITNNPIGISIPPKRVVIKTIPAMTPQKGFGSR